MAKTLLLISFADQVLKIARLSKEGLHLLDADAYQRPGLIDGIYHGRVVDKTPHLCFVDIGLNRPGLLRKEKDFPWLDKGREVLVQIAREAFHDPAEPAFLHNQKGVHLTQNIILCHQTCLLHPLKTPNFSLRQAAESASKETINSQLSFLKQQWAKIQGHAFKNVGEIFSAFNVLQRTLRDTDETSTSEILFDDASLFQDAKNFCQHYRPDLQNKLRVASLKERPLFEFFGISEYYDSCFETVVCTNDGSTLIIESTACVTSIDVNPGRLNSSATNLAIITDLACQLVWRHISGNVLIDFIDAGGSSKNHRLIEKKLSEALKDDRPSWKILGWSRQGMLELHRPKRRLPLNQRFS